MKHLRKYQQFITEINSYQDSDRLNEEILDWLKKKASSWLDNMRNIQSEINKDTKDNDSDEKKKELEELIQILPEEVIDTIKKEVELAAKSNNSNESIDVKLLLEAMFDALLGNIPTDDEIERMSDTEYDDYLKAIASDKYFKFDPNEEGSWTKGTSEFSELQNYLRSRGIDVNQDIIINHKPSTKNIESKIDALKISDSSKKALKVAAITVFFLLLSSKTFAASGAGHDSHHDKVEKGDAKYQAGGYGDVDNSDHGIHDDVKKGGSDLGQKLIDTYKKDPKAAEEWYKNHKNTSLTTHIKNIINADLAHDKYNLAELGDKYKGSEAADSFLHGDSHDDHGGDKKVDTTTKKATDNTQKVSGEKAGGQAQKVRYAAALGYLVSDDFSHVVDSSDMDMKIVAKEVKQYCQDMRDGGNKDDLNKNLSQPAQALLKTIAKTLQDSGKEKGAEYVAIGLTVKIGAPVFNESRLYRFSTFRNRYIV